MNSNLRSLDSDYVVIGGGIVGTCISYYLSCSNKDVICVDSGEFSGSTSNAGSLHVQLQSRNFRLNPHLIDNLKENLPFYKEAVNAWERLQLMLNADFELSVNGGLMVADNEEQLEFLYKKCQEEKAAGLDVEIIESNKAKFRLYNIITPIVSPLFLQTKPLPPNITLNINFRRSNADVPLFALEPDANNTYATSNVEILNPYLECTFIEDKKQNSKYKFLNTNELKYTLDEPLIRTFTVDSGLNTATFNVNTGGRLPYMLFSTIIKPAAFFGSRELSSTNFTRSSLTSFQVLVDNFSLPGSQVNMSEESHVEPYVAFLRNTKIYNNALAGKTLQMTDFAGSNFILSYDLSTIEQDSGWLSVKYDFDDYLSEKAMVVVYLLYEKQLVINKQGEVTINN